MQRQLTYKTARRQISKARCLARVLVAEDTRGTGPAGLLLVDQDPARGRVVVSRLDTVSAMIRCQCGAVVQEFGHSKLSGRLEYKTETEQITHMDVTVTSQEGQGIQHFRVQRLKDGSLNYHWKAEGGPEHSVLDREGRLYSEGHPLVEVEESLSHNHL
jgi:hypothetical protein